MTGESNEDIAPTATGDLLARLKQVLESTNTVVWEVDLDRMEADYFGPVEEVTGLPPGELTDPLAVNEQTTHPEDRETVAEAFGALLAGETETVDLEYRTNPEHGPVRWVRIQGFREPGPGDSTGSLVGFSTDITPLKEKEARLEEFAGIVAHDLRNPIAVAEGWLKLLQEAEPTEEVEHALVALDRMEGLIDDVLTLAREGEAIAARERVTLATVVDDAWTIVATPTATLRNEATGALRADRSRLQQVLENLFRNAVEHGSTSPGSQARQDPVEHAGEDVTVSVGVTDDGFYVEDDGPGIPPSDRGRLLGQAIDPSSKRAGLGLRIVAQIVDAHGWDVRITEGTTGGARFEVTGVEWC